jgi:AraC-like DNA-binding protein
MHSRSSGHAPTGWGSPKDALSSVLLDLRVTGTFFCHSEFTSDWGLQIAERDFASFHFAAAGNCFLQLMGKGKRASTTELRPGDLALVPRSPRQILSSDKRTKGTPIEELPAVPLTDTASPAGDFPGSSALRVGAEDARFRVVCGGVRFDGFAAFTLVNMLPEVIVLRKAGGSPIVTSALQAMKQESAEARPGSVSLMTRLADVVVIHAIREWLEGAEVESGWLAALRDPQIGQAMAEVHQRPAEAWSVDAMASIAHLSRSRFSERFSELVGEAPMQYVTKVRMHRARETLRTEKMTIAEVAEQFGYESEPAFARAFKRHIGVSPGAIRRS